MDGRNRQAIADGEASRQQVTRQQDGIQQQSGFLRSFPFPVVPAIKQGTDTLFAVHAMHHPPASYNQAPDYAMVARQAPAQYMQQQSFNVAPAYGGGAYHNLSMPATSMAPQMAVGYGAPMQYGGPMTPNASGFYLAHPYGTAQGNTPNGLRASYDTLAGHYPAPHFMPTPNAVGYTQGPGNLTHDAAHALGHSPVMYHAQPLSPGAAGFVPHVLPPGPPPHGSQEVPFPAYSHQYAEGGVASTSQGGQNPGSAPPADSLVGR
ncbi:hypothetical protein C8Q78DRAFT_992912 [Trametes maxima]|nr:hypothetical protein C8Q78DRAFT_992912 [Trametes maxima]